MQQFTGILGILAIIAACWACSTNRKAIKWKIVGWGLALQLLFAILVLKWDWGQKAMAHAGDAVSNLLGYANAGATFVFGPLADGTTQHSFALVENLKQGGFVFAFVILPTIIFMAAFFAVLYHFGIMQAIIKGAAWIMTRLMGVSGAESLDVAASIFMGQTEAPLTIRPFLEKLTKSEMMTVMTAGMAHVSGGIMAAYVFQGVQLKHLLGAVIMTAPGTLLISKMLVPETEVPVSGSKIHLEDADETKRGNLLGAISHGTSDGLNLAINVAAMLIAFLSLIALVNGLMGWVHVHWDKFPVDLQTVLGWLFAPIAWLIGIPWKDSLHIGSLLGIRMVGNELIAYGQMNAWHADLEARSITIATFALCGFANLSSIGIQIGGIGALAPSRKDDLAKLGFRAMLAGTMANLISAAIVSMMI